MDQNYKQNILTILLVILPLTIITIVYPLVSTQSGDKLTLMIIFQFLAITMTTGIFLHNRDLINAWFGKINSAFRLILFIIPIIFSYSWLNLNTKSLNEYENYLLIKILTGSNLASTLTFFTLGITVYFCSSILLIYLSDKIKADNEYDIYQGNEQVYGSKGVKVIMELGSIYDSDELNRKNIILSKIKVEIDDLISSELGIYWDTILRNNLDVRREISNKVIQRMRSSNGWVVSDEDFYKFFDQNMCDYCYTILITKLLSIIQSNYETSGKENVHVHPRQMCILLYYISDSGGRGDAKSTPFYEMIFNDEEINSSTIFSEKVIDKLKFLSLILSFGYQRFKSDYGYTNVSFVNHLEQLKDVLIFFNKSMKLDESVKIDSRVLFSSPSDLDLSEHLDFTTNPDVYEELKMSTIKFLNKLSLRLYTFDPLREEDDEFEVERNKLEKLLKKVFGDS